MKYDRRIFNCKAHMHRTCLSHHVYLCSLWLMNKSLIHRSNAIISGSTKRSLSMYALSLCLSLALHCVDVSIKMPSFSKILLFSSHTIRVCASIVALHTNGSPTNVRYLYLTDNYMGIVVVCHSTLAAHMLLVRLCVVRVYFSLFFHFLSCCWVSFNSILLAVIERYLRNIHSR